MATVEEVQAALCRYVDTRAKIESLLERKERVLARAACKTPSYSPAGGSPKKGLRPDRIGDALATVDEIESRLKALLTQQAEQYRFVDGWISRPELEPLEKEILTWRYIVGAKWERIAKTLCTSEGACRYSRPQMFRTHARALEKLAALWDKKPY